jgi:anti-sigma factor RsiW
LSDHVSSALLNALADGELAADQLASVNQHLAHCPQCTSSALTQSLLKTATARAGHRFASPADLRERMVKLVSDEALRQQTAHSDSTLRPVRTLGAYGWTMAAAILLLCTSLVFVQRWMQRNSAASEAHAGLVTEVCDQHIATLAENSPPEVNSSDRHTVKPWFQGKIPFSFNLPQNLPGDTTLDGANLTFLNGRPTAQLMYRIGKHRVSVFVQQSGGVVASSQRIDRSGFHVIESSAGELEIVAVSDVEASRLAELAGMIDSAQTGTQPQSR